MLNERMKKEQEEKEKSEVGLKLPKLKKIDK